MRVARGLTLLEVLVTLSLFSLILALTLFFYGQSLKATRRQDQGSRVYRRAHVLFSKIERFLHSGILMRATDHQLMLSPFREVDAITQSRLLNWSDQAHTLSATENEVNLQVADKVEQFAQLESWEALSFAPQTFDEDEEERRLDYVTLLYSGKPPAETRDDRIYKFQRQVLLVRY